MRDIGGSIVGARRALGDLARGGDRARGGGLAEYVPPAEAARMLSDMSLQSVVAPSPVVAAAPLLAPSTPVIKIGGGMTCATPTGPRVRLSRRLNRGY